MVLNKPQTLRTLRLILTSLTLFLITWYYQLPEREWSLVTVWFVMFEYTNVGGVLRKSVFRFSGTLASAIYATIIIYFFANNVVVNMIAFAVGIFIYAHYFFHGDKTYIGVIGSVTLSIALLNHNDIDAAILRTFNIFIGVFTSMFMIRFFFPIYARDELLIQQNNLIEPLVEMLTTYLDDSKSLEQIQEIYSNLEPKMLKSLITFETCLNEAKIETGETPLFTTYNAKAAKHIRHLFRLLSVFINYVSTEELRKSNWVRQHLNQLTLDLKSIQDKLDKLLTKKTSSLPLFDLPLETIDMQMIKNLQEECALLDTEIDKMLSIYKDMNN